MTQTTDHRNALPTGHQLQEYTLQSLLGDGGFGITYLAQDTQLNSQVAIKEYLPNDLAVRESDYTVQAKSQQYIKDYDWGLKRFLQEARILAQFKHPNIVRVLRHFNTHNTGYIVMEYEHGKSLTAFLKKRETIVQTELMEILLPLLDALETVHNAGYLHRDIKPDNIYLRDKDNTPVLLDFGAARFVVGRRSHSLTSIMTAGYAPFEQYAIESNHGVWSDIYSLGAVLYRLISDHTPVDAIQRVDALRRHQADPLEPAIEIGHRQYSRHLLQAIDWALRINEEERPKNIHVWRAKLMKQERSYSGSKKYFQHLAENLKIILSHVFQKKWIHSSNFRIKSKKYNILILSILIAIGGYELVNHLKEHNQPKPKNEEIHRKSLSPPKEMIPWSIPKSEQKVKSIEHPLIQMAKQEALEIGRKIWKNETSGQLSELILWNRREKAASLGIGHFIWYPENKKTGIFPQFLNFIQKQGITIPLWLQNSSHSPWYTHQTFLDNQESYQMRSLRRLMKNTITQQVQFMMQHLELTLPYMLDTLPTEKQRLQVYEQFYRLTQTSRGIYAMIDYVNFKGKGIYPNERYQEQGWGLLQVLEKMSGYSDEHAAEEFAKMAAFILERRVQNAPQEFDEARWLQGWQKRVSSYK